jgi:hypothetical protein
LCRWESAAAAATTTTATRADGGDGKLKVGPSQPSLMVHSFVVSSFDPFLFGSCCVDLHSWKQGGPPKIGTPFHKTTFQTKPQEFPHASIVPVRGVILAIKNGRVD